MHSLYLIIDQILGLYMMAVVISVVLSWLYQFKILNTSSQFVNMISGFFYRVTEPALARIRRFVPNLGGIDISPIVLLFGIYFTRSLLAEYWPR